MGFRPKLGADGKPLESVDELPPWRQLIPLGLQHVLAMYAGAVAVPLVVGGALIAAGQLNPDDLGYLVTADLFVAGIATLIQSIGLVRRPVAADAGPHLRRGLADDRHRLAMMTGAGPAVR